MGWFRREVYLILVAMTCVLWSSLSFAYRNEPKEFRGMRWGTPVIELEGMVLVLDGGALKAYVKKNDEMRLADAELERVHYIFYRERFYCVHMEFSGADNFSKIKKMLVEWYGPAEEKEAVGKNFYWVGATASVVLNYSESTEKGELGYKYMPIDAEIELDERS